MNSEVFNLVRNSGLNTVVCPNPKFPISLNWMNEPKTCLKIKKEIKLENSYFNLAYKKLNKQLDQLKNINIWLKVNSNIIPMTAYDLYETLFNHLKTANFEDQLFNSQNISFISPAGPYKSLTLVECIHKETFDKFLSVKTVQNKLAQRCFRLNASGKIKTYYGDFFQEESSLDLEQITESGLLFSSSDEKLLELVEEQYQLKFQMSIKYLDYYFDQQACEIPENPFCSESSLEFFTMNQKDISKNLKFDSAMTGKFYLFCRFEKIIEKEFADSIRKFICEFKSKL